MQIDLHEMSYPVFKKKKKKKNISNLSSAELARRMVKVKAPYVSIVTRVIKIICDVNDSHIQILT